MKKRTIGIGAATAAVIVIILLAVIAILNRGSKPSQTAQDSKPASTLVIVDASSAEQTESKPPEPVQTDSSAAESSAGESTAAKPGTTVTQQTTAADTSVYTETTASLTVSETTVAVEVIAKDGVYTTKDDVALYIYTYGKLPQNFITKKEAEKLGWSGGSLERYAPGKCIGGSRFGNYEGKLPDKRGRQYTECDIDTLGKSSRGAKRIVFSNDGLIYYTGDHYQTFELLYGEAA